jgi:hypothetical protein
MQDKVFNWPSYVPAPPAAASMTDSLESRVAGSSSDLKTWLAAFPSGTNLPFWPPPDALYAVADLYAGYSLADPDSWRQAWDTQVFEWTLDEEGKPRSFSDGEMVAARLHDAAIDRLVRRFVDPRHKVTVGFMGGHDILRTDPSYAQVGRLARELRRRDFHIVTGGGPGLMEAANFGALLAPHADAEFDAALAVLRRAPDYGASRDAATAEAHKRDWLQAAALARQTLLGRWDAPPKPGGDSLGIPTWYYGSEPPNLFATHSGKYFLNSLREDGLVSVANGGLVFSKGAAGTVQEVFQNANYNYYRGDEVAATPMMFLGVDFWNPSAANDAAADGELGPGRLPVFPLMQALAAHAAPPFTDSLLLSDDPDRIARFLGERNADRLKPRLGDVRLEDPSTLPPPRRPVAR